MKHLTVKSRIISAIAILIIIIGAVVVWLKGFNFDLRYQSNQMIEIYLEDEFNMDDIKAITDEVFGDSPVLLQVVEMFGDTVAITANEITEEQKTSIIEKVNEKYELELTDEDVTIENVPHTRLRDILEPYVIPVIVATVIILVYMAIRYRELGTIKVILQTGGIAIVAQAVLFSLMAITRFPIGRYTIPLMLFVYLISMLGITSKLEKDLTKNKLKEVEDIENEKSKKGKNK